MSNDHQTPFTKVVCTLYENVTIFFKSGYRTVVVIIMGIKLKFFKQSNLNNPTFICAKLNNQQWQLVSAGDEH